MTCFTQSAGKHTNCFSVLLHSALCARHMPRGSCKAAQRCGRRKGDSLTLLATYLWGNLPAFLDLWPSTIKNYCRRKQMFQTSVSLGLLRKAGECDDSKGTTLCNTTRCAMCWLWDLSSGVVLSEDICFVEASCKSSRICTSSDWAPRTGKKGCK